MGDSRWLEVLDGQGRSLAARTGTAVAPEVPDIGGDPWRNVWRRGRYTVTREVHGGSYGEAGGQTMKGKIHVYLRGTRRLHIYGGRRRSKAPREVHDIS